MQDATKRSIRTGYQVTLGLIAVSPVLLSGVNDGAKAASIIGAVALVAKVLNALEDAGLVPAWLKGDKTVPAPAEVPSA